MAKGQTILMYRSTTAGVTPPVASLQTGEMAVNTTDATVFMRDTAGTAQQVGGKGPYTTGLANLFWATPSATSGVPSLRAITTADLPLITPDKISGTWAAKAAITVTGTTATSLLSGTKPSVTLVAGRSLQVSLAGIVTTGLTPGTMVLQVKLGGTVVASSTAFGILGSLTGQIWIAEILLTCYAAGTSGTVVTQGMMNFSGSMTGIVNQGSGGVTPVVVNTTAALTLDVVLTLSAVSGASIVCTNALVVPLT